MLFCRNILALYKLSCLINTIFYMLFFLFWNSHRLLISIKITLIFVYRCRDWEEFFVKETMAPYFWPHQGAILENNVPFQISNRPQLWLVKLRASLCIDKYNFLDLYGLCKGFSDVSGLTWLQNLHIRPSSCINS